jgi:hypothetical protein
MARWDGSAWHAMGGGVAPGASVQAMVEFEDELVVAGRFDSIDGMPASSIARWNGRSWETFGGGFDRDVHALAAYGHLLVAGGAFNRAGDAEARALAAWDGRRWQPLGADLPGSFPTVRVLTLHDGDLVAAGRFRDPNRGPGNPILRWNGRSWQPVGRGMGGGGAVFALVSTDDGVDSDFLDDDPLHGDLLHDDLIDGDLLFAGGSFADAGGYVANGLASFDRSRWRALSAGAGFDGPIRTLCRFQDRIVAGGTFSRAGTRRMHGVASWDGRAWNPLGPGLQGTVRQLAEYRGDLVAAGRFALDETSAEVNVARWTGSHWEALGAGLNGSVLDLAVYQGELWAVGRFTASGTVPMQHLAAWNGQAWRGLTLSLDVDIGDPEMTALAVYDGALVVGGRFSRINGLVIANLAARENGIWYGFQEGVDEVVEDLVVHQGKLYAAGFFNYAGSLFAPQVAAWDSVALDWSPVGTGLRFDEFLVPDAVLRLHSFGPDLLLGGRFDGIDDVRAHNVARWDGARWWPLGAGTNDPCLAFASRGESLFLGGSFVRAGGAPSSFIAHWNRDLPSPVDALQAQVMEGSVVLRWELDGTVLDRIHIVRALRSQEAGAERELPGSPLLPTASMRLVDASPARNTSYRYRLLLVRTDGSEVDAGSVRIDTGALERTHLYSPRINTPGAVDVRYSIGRVTTVELSVIDVRGRLLKTLVHAPHEPGDYTATWNREMASGSRAPRGVYLLHLRAGTTSATRKLVLLDN